MDFALVAARFAHYAAIMGLFGAAGFEIALAPPSLADDLKPLRRLFTPLAALALASAPVWGALVARDMAGGELEAGVLWTALTQTEFGWVWQGRLALLLLLIVAAGRARLALAALALGSLALTGHAAMQGGALGAAHRLNDAVHLLAVSAWVGGLAPFLVCLKLYRASPERRDALTAMRNYSRAGHFVVAAVLVTGAGNVALTVGALPWPPQNPYRLALDIKIACVLAMVALALVNRYLTAPRIQGRGAAQALAAGALAEIALGVAAVALVAFYGIWAPR